MDSFKTWMVEVGWKKIAPSLIKGALAALMGIMAAHQGVLAHLGITWDASGHTIDIDTDILSQWLLVAGSGGIMAIFTAVQHHTGAVIKNEPQSGDIRTYPQDAVPGGQRSTDASQTK